MWPTPCVARSSPPRSRRRSAAVAAPPVAFAPPITHALLRCAAARPLCAPCVASSRHALRTPRRRARVVAVAERGSTPAPVPGDGGDAVVASESALPAPAGDVAAVAATPAERPAWAPEWLPSCFWTLKDRPWLQLMIMLPLYAVHLFVFSTKGWKLDKPLIPNNKNLFQSLGYDSAVGAVVAVLFLVWRKWFAKVGARSPPEPIVPPLLQSADPPWSVPRASKRRIGRTTAMLVFAFIGSGYFALFIEQILYLLAGYNVPLTVATTRAWKVLLGHLVWVFMGIRILRGLKPFFPPKGTWLRWKWKENWLWWAIGGYYVSALLFNIADVVNQLVLPASMFEEETVVSKLINPENKDVAAMAIGSIGPCISAPVFEEVLYRGFLLPALTCFLPMWAAIPASSVLFALHHQNPTSVLPLSVLGLVWAVLYTKSRNLSVTVLIHAMWNTRVFLSSFLGLKTFTDFE